MERRYDRQRPQRVMAFIVELLEVCEKHGLSLSHEDKHGQFLIENYDRELAEWLEAAGDDSGVS